MNSGEFIEMKDPNEGNDPTEDEIEEYAQWLGADLEKDRELFWIAREALTVPLPPGWKVYQKRDGSGDPFYFNVQTGESSWDHPLDQHYKDLFIEEKKKRDAGQTRSRPEAALGSKSPTTIDKLEESNDQIEEIQQKHNSLLESETLKFQKQLQDLRSKNQAEKQTIIDDFNREISEMQSKHRKEMEEIQKQHEQEKSNLDKLQNDLQQKKQQLAKESNEIDMKFKELEKKLDEIVENHNKEKEEILAMNKKELENIKKTHEIKMAAEKSTVELTKTQSAEIEKLKNKHTAEIMEINKKHKQEVNNLNKKNADEISSIQQKQEEEVDELKEKHQEAIRKAEQANKKALDELNKKQRKELEDKKTEFESKKEEMENEFNAEFERIGKGKGSINDLRSHYEAEISRLKKQLAEYGQVSTLKTSFQIRKQDLETEFEEELEEMRRQHSLEMAKLKRQQDKKKNAAKVQEEQDAIIAQMNEDFAQQKEDLEAQFADEIAHLTNKHKRTLNRLKKQQQSELDNAKEEHDDAMERIKEENERQLEKLRSKYQKQIQQETSSNEKELELARFRKAQQQQQQQQEQEIMRRRSLRIMSSIPVSIAPIRKNRLHNSPIQSMVFNHTPFFSIEDRIIFSSIPRNFSQMSQPPLSISRLQPQSDNSSRFSNTPYVRYQEPEMAMGMDMGMGMGIQTQSMSAMAMNAKSKNRVSKASDQFDTACSELSSSMVSNANAVGNVVSSFRSFVSDQNRELSRLSMDAQQQSAQATRQLSQTLASIEVLCMDSINQARAQAMQSAAAIPVASLPVTVPPPSVHRRARQARIIREEDSGEDFLSQESSEDFLFIPPKKASKATRRYANYD